MKKCPSCEEEIEEELEDLGMCLHCGEEFDSDDLEDDDVDEDDEDSDSEEKEE